jgi:hypothetical protein
MLGFAALGVVRDNPDSGTVVHNGNLDRDRKNV